MSFHEAAQAASLRFKAAFTHTANNEAGEIHFENLSTSNEAQLLASVTAFHYDERGIDGRQLPPDVAYELRIAESLVDAQSLFVSGTFQASSVRHESPAGTRRFRIVGEPIWPSGAVRVWRFWMAPSEVI